MSAIVKPTVEQLVFEMDNDIERYPLPICFDPEQERKEMFRRKLKIRAIAERYVRIINSQNKA